MLEINMRLRGRSIPLVLAVVVAGGLCLAAAMPSDAHAQGIEARPWLGVAMDADTQGAGVRVGHVVRGSPAEKAGIREGDRIVRLAGSGIARSADVVRVVSGYSVGDSLESGFVRGGQPRSAKATLAPFPSQDD